MTTLLLANVAATIAVAALLATKTVLRLWVTPADRSVFLIVVSVGGFCALGLAVRFGMPRGPLWEHLLVAIYLSVAVAAAYRVHVHLDQARGRRAARLGATSSTGPVRHVDDVAGEITRLERRLEQRVLDLEHAEVCANCTEIRAELLDIMRQLQHLRAQLLGGAS